MKTLFALFIGFISCSAFAGNDEAIAYNDKIVTEQNKIGKMILAFSEAPSDETLNGIQEQSKSSIAVLKKMKSFDNNDALLTAAKALFAFYLEITQNEYKKLLEILKNKDKYTTEERTSKLNALVSAISAKEKPLDEQYQVVQEAFAKKYGFELQKNELQEEIDSAGNKH